MKAKISKLASLETLILLIIFILIFNLYINYIKDIYGTINKSAYTLCGFGSCILLVLFLYKLIIISTTKLECKDNKIYGKTGLFSSINLEINLDKINDIVIKQNIIGKLFGYSTLIICTSSNKYKFNYIKNSNDIRNYIIK